MRSGAGKGKAARDITIIRMDCGLGRGGAERYCRYLCEGLLSSGFKVRLVGERCDEDLKGSVDFVPIEVARLNSVTRNLSFHRGVQTVLRRYPSTISYSLSRTWPVDIFRVTDPLHRHNLNLKYSSLPGRIWTAISPRHRVLSGLERGVMRPGGCKKIITISQLDKTLVQEYFKVPAEKVTVIYNGVDLGYFTPLSQGQIYQIRKGLGIEADVTCYIFPAMDFKRKGLKTLFSGLSMLPFPWRLLVVGKGDIHRFKKMAAKLGISKRVLFLGRRNDMRELYCAADLMVLPTLYDPFGNVHLEALACGTPVLTTASAGGAESVIPGRTGYVLHDSRDASTLARYLHDFEQRRDEWASWRDNARKSAMRFTREENIRKTIEVIEEVSDESRK